MTKKETHDVKQFAKMMTAACVRRGHLEQLHDGIHSITHTGDYSDVKVIDANGREIPWQQVSRIDQAEMKMLMIGIVNRVYTFLMRTLYHPASDPEFEKAMDRAALRWVKDWDEPKYLDDFLMPVLHKNEQ
jgi:hypothetical protein